MRVATETAGQSGTGKGPGDCRTPKPIGHSKVSVTREASWSAPVLWRFGLHLPGVTAVSIAPAWCLEFEVCFAPDTLFAVSDLIKHVQQNIASRALLKSGRRVLVAVSGGLDSMVLLHLLCR